MRFHLCSSVPHLWPMNSLLRVPWWAVLQLEGRCRVSELKEKDLDPGPTRLALPVDPARDHTLGPPTAAVTLLEYGDYECPDCGRAYPMLKDLPARFGDQL